jgi:hypothetical protein
MDMADINIKHKKSNALNLAEMTVSVNILIIK